MECFIHLLLILTRCARLLVDILVDIRHVCLTVKLVLWNRID